jgi:hypothetical protein
MWEYGRGRERNARARKSLAMAELWYVRRFHSHSSAAPTGILEGHLKILSLKEVELQDDAKAIT